MFAHARARAVLTRVASWQVLDRDLIGSDEHVGSVRVRLEELAVNVTDTRWWPLEPPPASKGLFSSRVKADATLFAQLRPEICLIITVADLFDLAPSTDALKKAPAFLRVHVVKAAGLETADGSVVADPFVLVEVGNKRTRTPARYSRPAPQTARG